eukprot:scaffold1659_cov255-Pinguiococcus_pyrenoidosus.AAC.17
MIEVQPFARKDSFPVQNESWPQAEICTAQPSPSPSKLLGPANPWPYGGLLTKLPPRGDPGAVADGSALGRSPLLTPVLRFPYLFRFGKSVGR